MEEKAKVKATNRARRRTIPKSNVGIVKSWDTKLLCVRRRRKEGKEKPMATFAEIESFSKRFDREFGFIACEATSAGSHTI